MLLNEIKKAASNFLQDKYKIARVVLTDVSEAEILAEEATNSDPFGPDARIMTRLSEAAYDIDDYRRIVDVLHRRFCTVDWKEWRQFYKTLSVLEFLLTHGPEGMFDEFDCDLNIIRDLSNFNYIDDRGFDWGACMRSKSKRIVCLLSDEELLKEEREKALRVTREIQGFGNLIVTPSPSSPSSSRSSRTSSFSSYSCDTPTWGELDGPYKEEEHYILCDSPTKNLHKRSPRHNSPNKELTGGHLWNYPIEERNTLLIAKEEEREEDPYNEREEDQGGWSSSSTFGDTWNKPSGSQRRQNGKRSESYQMLVLKGKKVGAANFSWLLPETKSIILPYFLIH